VCVRAEQKPPHDAVRRVGLRVILEISAEPARLPFGIDGGARNETDFRREVVDRQDEEIVGAIVRDAAPRHAADVPRYHERPLA
jgi:hypothetical protein